MIHVLDLIGVFAFASFGAYRGLRANMDVLGALLCAGLTSLGGGTVREVILGGRPAYLSDYTYVLAVVAGTALAIGAYRNFERITGLMSVLDGVGLVTFALIGATRAVDAGLGPGPMILFAALTGAGGGIVCDLLVRRRPTVLYGDFYVIPACVLAVLAYPVRHSLHDVRVAVPLLVLVFAMHMWAASRRWRVWRPVSTPDAPAEETTVRMSRADLRGPAAGSWWDQETVRVAMLRADYRPRVRPE